MAATSDVAGYYDEEQGLLDLGHESSLNSIMKKHGSMLYVYSIVVNSE
jgi:hypothetical protein